MKKIILFPALLLALWCGAQPLTIGTFNLRYDNSNDEGDLWKDRARPVAALIRFHDFDVLGTQEGLTNQLNDIAASLPEYTRYGAGRDDGKEGGEHSAIFFKTNKFNLLSKGDFWLSQTPSVPGKGWDATCCNRICSWVCLQDKATKKQFYFFSVHFDHQGVVARRESAGLMLEKIKQIAKNQPAILVGDFNADRNSEPYQILKNAKTIRDSYYDVKFPYENNASFNAFGKQSDRTEVIDHIFITPQFIAKKWGILTDTYHGKFPSDHFPVMAVVELK